MTPQDSPTPVIMQLPKERIVDAIIYTAELSSSVETVDPLLDTLRAITANHTGDYNFSSQEIVDLYTLQQKLESYLVHDEKMRTFDYESLHLHIQEHIAHGSSASVLNLVLVAIFVVSLAIGAASLLLPLRLSSAVRLLLFATIAYSTVYLGAAGLFLGARRKLSSQMRKAYMYMCFTAVIVALASLLHPLVNILRLQEQALMPTILVVPFVPAYLVFYVGVRMLGRLSGVEGRLLSTGFLVGMAGGFAVGLLGIATLVGSYANSSLALPYILSAIFFQGIALAIMAVVGMILYRAQQKLTYLYVRPIKALLQTSISGAAIAAYFITYWIFVGSLHPNIWLNIGAAGIILNAILYIRAAYAFNKIHYY